MFVLFLFLPCVWFFVFYLLLSRLCLLCFHLFQWLEGVLSVSHSSSGCLWTKQRPPKWEHTDTIYSELAAARSQPPSLVILRGSKQEGSGKLYRKGRFQVCFLFWGCCHGEAEGWLRRSGAYDGIHSGSILTFSGGSWVGQSEDKELGSWQSLPKSRPFQASGCRGGDLASWSGCSKGFGLWFSGHVLSGHCPFVYQFLSFQELYLGPCFNRSKYKMISCGQMGYESHWDPQFTLALPFDSVN